MASGANRTPSRERTSLMTRSCKLNYSPAIRPVNSTFICAEAPPGRPSNQSFLVRLRWILPVTCKLDWIIPSAAMTTSAVSVWPVANFTARKRCSVRTRCSDDPSDITVDARPPTHIDPRALIAHEDTISFEPTALTTDAIVFNELVARQGAEHLEQAIALYAGELLEGFQVAASEFESWATSERERFREMALEAMTKLLDHHLSKGAVERGIRIAARLLVADPLQERVHRTLMELYCRQGRHGAALRQYRTCADLLAKELGIEPDATTKALRREILREWNQQQGTTSGADAAARSLCEVEIEPPIAPRSPERRQVTVLVCDLAGTGALASRLDPEELQALITAYQRCCTPIISRSGGVMGKLAGTEMLAHFGHPQAHEHDIECAVRAGLTLVEAVSKLDCGNAGPLQLRVGIATGPVVVGDLLGNGADQQVIIGEAPQLAGSLERVAEPNTIVIAASTRQLVGNLFDYDDLGQITLNGFSEPVPAWRVLGPSGLDSRFEALRAPTTPLVGRDEELELLLRRWRQAASGDGRVVLLAGEPGIGKSRLTAELHERLQVESHMCLRNFCSPHHQGSALIRSSASSNGRPGSGVTHG